MPTMMRLQRHGKKGRPFYHIVIADGRAPRDGKFIEKIGTYNPITTPAEIDLNLDRAVYWLQTGAQPTDTVKSILSYKGAVYKNHLLNGVRKGAFTEEQVEIKFQAWMTEKQEKISNKLNEVTTAEKEDLKKRLDAEKEVNEARAKAIAEKRAAEVEEKLEEVKAEIVEEAVEEPKGEEPKGEEKSEKREEKEEVKAEVKEEEPKAEEKAEEKEEVKEEEKKEEVKDEKEEEPEAKEDKKKDKDKK